MWVSAPHGLQCVTLQRAIRGDSHRTHAEDFYPEDYMNAS